MGLPKINNKNNLTKQNTRRGMYVVYITITNLYKTVSKEH